MEGYVNVLYFTIRLLNGSSSINQDFKTFFFFCKTIGNHYIGSSQSFKGN